MPCWCSSGGLPLQVAAALLVTPQIVAIVGRIVIGHACDRWVTPRVMPATCARCSGGNQVFTFAGAVLCRFLLAKLPAHGAGCATAFISLGILAAVAGVAMLTHARSRRADQVLRANPTFRLS